MKKEIIKKKVRNIFILIAIMTLTFIVFCKIFSDARNALYLNWKIYKYYWIFWKIIYNKNIEKCCGVMCIS